MINQLTIPGNGGIGSTWKVGWVGGEEVGGGGASECDDDDHDDDYIWS